MYKEIGIVKLGDLLKITQLVMVELGLKSTLPLNLLLHGIID